MEFKPIVEPRTIPKLLELLPPPYGGMAVDRFESYWESIRAEVSTRNALETVEYDNVQLAIQSAFPWKLTPEKYDFWHSVWQWSTGRGECELPPIP